MTIQEERPTAKRFYSRAITLLVLLVVALAAGFAWRSMHKSATTAAAQNQGDTAARRAVPVIVSTAAKQDLPIYLDGLGSVTAFNTVTVKSRVDGQLTEIHFKEGQEVHKGDLLAVVDPRPFEVALSQAKAGQFRDQSQLTDATRNVDRYTELAKEGVVSQQQSDTQRALAGQLEGAVRADQAQIDSATLNITYSHITSPIDGRVGLRLVDVGNMVHATDANGLLVITQMQPIAVIFTLPEDTLPALNSRMRGSAPLQVKALSRDIGTELESGTLLTIDNQIDQTTGTYRLKAVFDNRNRTLWPNQFVNARLLIDVKKDAVIIPAVAVQNGAQGLFVYTVKSDKTAEVHPVKVSVSQGSIVAIEKGLAPGDQVVTDGQDRLRAGMLVDPRPEGKGTGRSGSTGSASGESGGQPRKQKGNRSDAESGDPAAQSSDNNQDSGRRGRRGGQSSDSNGQGSQRRGFRPQ